jgi:hypothetical protein
MSYCLHTHDMYVKVGHASPKTCILTASLGFTVFGIAMAEGDARFDTDRDVQSDNCFPLPGILFLRTYALYHGNKKFLAFLFSFFVVSLPLLLHWVFKVDCVILVHARYRYRHRPPFRAFSAMYVISISGLISRASSSL